jgi:hypothetical protein
MAHVASGHKQKKLTNTLTPASTSHVRAIDSYYYYSIAKPSVISSLALDRLKSLSLRLTFRLCVATEHGLLYRLIEIIMHARSIRHRRYTG